MPIPKKTHVGKNYCERSKFVDSASGESHKIKPDIDWSGMKDWYINACIKHKKFDRLKTARFLLHGQACSALIIFLVYPSTASYINLFLSCLILAIYWYYKLEEGKTNTTNYVVLERSQFKEIWALCDKLKFDMGLEIYDFEIFYIKSNTFDAHVSFNDEKISLFLSRK